MITKVNIEKLPEVNKIKKLAIKMEHSPDFGYDDEAVEMGKILKKYSMKWKWSDSYNNPEVIIKPFN